MNSEIEVLGVRLSDCSARDAIQKIAGYIKEEVVSMVEIVTVQSVMRATQEAQEQRKLEQMDLILPGDRALLEAAEITDEKLLKDAEHKKFVRILFQYLHKNRSSVFLLADSEEELENLRVYLQEEYGHIQIKGTAVLSDGEEADDMVINKINGAEAECILASVTSFRQEAFICRCRQVLNVRLWVGINGAESFYETCRHFPQRFFLILSRRHLKRKVVQEKKRRNA